MPLFAGPVSIESMKVQDETTEAFVAKSRVDSGFPRTYIVIETFREPMATENTAPRRVKRCIVFDEMIEYKLLPNKRDDGSEDWTLATLSQSKRRREASFTDFQPDFAWFVQVLMKMHPDTPTNGAR